MPTEVGIDEKLVEEIRLEYWCKHCDSWWEFTEGEREVGDPLRNCELDAQESCNERARKVITLIAQAIADGKVKLPGEVERGHFRLYDELGDVVRPRKKFKLNTDYPFIAIRQEEEKGGE